MRRMTKVLLMLTLSLSVGTLHTASADAASPAPVRAENGMVVSAHRLASEVGVDILRKGGNAIDAAVAVGYALAVVYPTAGNIGGGGFMTIRLKDGRTSFLDFRERAPLASTKTMYLDDKGNVVDGLSTDGYLAVGVPGSVMGFETALTRFGTMRRAMVMAPAVRLAREGFLLEDGDVVTLTGGLEMIRLRPRSSSRAARRPSSRVTG